MEQKGQRSKQKVKAKYLRMTLERFESDMSRFKFRSNENLILISIIQFQTLKNVFSVIQQGSNSHDKGKRLIGAF